ncbi:steroid binding [Coemansia sp. RSA 376]|nr:steroid binding [Coemansia sp. S3946]KAJ2036414.1 steroid binding [Coemansia sp. S16]KAJ2051300.1 steroid binding [Coemansia sp. S2]KAJ2101626.1 Cytochrome b5-like Heme/Steroid binding domain [Coemansia sp. RSA 922]KAJ2259211.1 steroid binding [Coemansia sp. RSA 376]KAJ2427129.1 steroid binding [Coemansia sp. RSA 2531]
MSSQKFTLRELQAYTGLRKGERILLGLNGNVYDVSAGASFYGPGNGYSVFAGRDSTVGLAKGSLLRSNMPGPGDAPTTLDKLSETEKKAVLDWEEKLKKKYPVVGMLVKESPEKEDQEEEEEFESN